MKLRFHSWTSTFTTLGYKLVRRQRSPKNASPNLSIEELEPRQMLSGSDATVDTISFTDSGSPYAPGNFSGTFSDATPGAQYTIQIDTTGNGSSNAASPGPISSTGSFSIQGSLSSGTHTIFARVGEYSSGMGGLSFDGYGSWQQFNLGVSNDAPTADNESFSVHNTEILTVDGSTSNLLFGDHDPDNDSLQAVLQSTPAHGTLKKIDGTSLGQGDFFNGQFIFEPDPQYEGSDSFTYSAHDGTDESAPATVSITITTPPVADATLSALDFTPSYSEYAPAISAEQSATRPQPAITASCWTSTGTRLRTLPVRTLLPLEISDSREHWREVNTRFMPA